MRKLLLYIVFIYCAIVFSSCGIYGKYSRPTDITGENLYGAGVTENADSLTLAMLSYKEIFTDPMLQNLIAAAIERNSDLKSLEFTIKQAEAGYRSSVIPRHRTLKIYQPAQ